MRTKILLMAVVLAGLLFSLSASAQIACTCDDPITTQKVRVEVPIQKTSFDIAKDIPKFDSSLGCLQSVKLTSQSCGFVWTEVDNEDTMPVVWNVVAIGGVRIVLPEDLGEEFVTFGTPEEGVPLPTGADDSAEGPADEFNPDYAGPDYNRVDYGSLANPVCSPVRQFVYETEDEVAPFIGSAGQTLALRIASESESDALGPSTNRGLQSLCFAGGWAEIEYTYCPPEKFCINGTKINDCTGAGIPEWEICLTKPDGEKICTQTNDNGDFSFCELDPGTYTVCEADRDGWVHRDEPCRTVTLEDESEEGIEFHNMPLFCISGHKYNSDTGAGISGWKITLLDANGVEIANKLTGTGGYYEFCGLLPGDYTVVEETRSGWKAITPISIPVTLDCANSENNDFENQPPDLVCVCPFIIKNELYTANCDEIKEVDASKGLLANDPVGSVVLNPELITIDPKYGTIDVNADGSFVYDPTVATGRLYTGLYLTIKYSANNGFCDSKYLGVAKIQIRCK